jgi:hypothetical protein
VLAAGLLAIGVPAAVLLGGCRGRAVANRATPVEEARQAAVKDAASPEGHRWEQEHSVWIGAVVAPILKRCVAETRPASLDNFSVYLRLSHEGDAYEAVAAPSTPVTLCFANGTKGIAYPDVPREGYWLEIEMRLRE